MSIGRIIKRIWYGPPLVTRAGEIKTGKAVVEGKAATLEDMIKSPLTGTDCIAYKYRASYRTPSRTQGVAERLLKETEVYASSFEIGFDDGKIRVVPVDKGDFDKQEHQKLQSGGFMGFSAREMLVRPGTKVRVLGIIKKQGKDDFVLRSKKIEIVAETAAGPALKSRKKKQKKKKKKNKG